MRVLTISADGYKSLLIEEEGGQAVELVSEENGILISMMLRQYFMSLKVLDQWADFGPSMKRHWGKVVSNVTKSHPCMEPKHAPVSSPIAQTPVTPISSKGSKRGWEHYSPEKMRQRRSSVGPLTERETDVERDGSSPLPEPRPLEGIAEQDDDEEAELRIMRKTFRKWCKKAGVNARAGEGLQENEVDCDWTKAIAPQVEGRISMVGE